MSIDIKSTAVSIASAPTSNNKVSSSTSGTADKTSSDSTFKDEMNKVSQNKSENNSAEKVAQEKSAKVEKKELKTSDKNSKLKSENMENTFTSANPENNEGSLINPNSQMDVQKAFSSANSLLSSDIAQMIENTSNICVNDCKWSISIGNSNINTLKMNESDASFFLNLTQSSDLSSNNMIAQAQKMIEAGMDTKQDAKNFKISQALLNALRESRQNNQPLRIDFDKDISVILRVDRDGALAARFIPGDRAVEQYLKSNISSLKAAFDENELPYTDLSYSTSSKQQNKKRREEKQGE